MGIKLSPHSAEIETNPKRIKELEIRHWSKIFGRGFALDVQAAANYLARWAVKFKWRGKLRAPEDADYEKLLEGLVSTAPGPDGIPYHCWHVFGPWSHWNLWHLGCALSSGLRIPLSLNSSVAVFPPKGSHPEDTQLVAREASSTRPLMLKQSGLETSHGNCEPPHRAHHFLLGSSDAKWFRPRPPAGREHCRHGRLHEPAMDSADIPRTTKKATTPTT